MNVNKLVKWMTSAVILLVALIGTGSFILSYGALLSIGISNGMPADWRGYIWPLLTDAGLIVFSLSLLTAQVTRQRVSGWVLVVGALSLASMVFNVAHAGLIDHPWYHIGLKVVVNIWPALMLIAVVEALRHLLKTVIDRQGMVVTMTTLSQEKEALEGQKADLAAQVKALKRQLAEQQEKATRPSPAELKEAKQARLKEVEKLQKEGVKSKSELARLTGVSEATITRDLAELKQLEPVTVNGNGHKNGKVK